MTTYINGVTTEDARSLARGVTIGEIQTAIASLQSDHSMALLAENDAVYADGKKGEKDPTGANAGWHFKNTADLTEKINWYYLANNNPSNNLTISSLSAMYAVVHVTEELMPYFIHYTQPQGDVDDAAAWYRSRTVMSTTVDMSGYVGQDVLLHFGDVTGILPSLPRVLCTADAASEGPQAATETISFGALSTSTGYAAASYDFVVSQVGFVNAANNTQVHLLHQDTPASEPVGYSNTHYVALDATDDYIELVTPGIEIDFTGTKSWSIAIKLESVSSINDSSFCTLFKSGDNIITLRKGGTNWGVYVMSNTGSLWQANMWHAPVAGSQIIFRYDHTYGSNGRLHYYLHNAHDGGMWTAYGTINSTYATGSAEANTIQVGKGGAPGIYGGVYPANSWFGGINNITLWDSMVSGEMLTEYLSSDDVTSHSYYAADVSDFIPCGEGIYPNVNGLKGNVTGALINGTPEDFVEIV